MNSIDRFSDIETTCKPISRKLQRGQDFQILAKAYGHTSISINRDCNDKILMCQGNDLLLIGISFKSGMTLEENTSSLPSRFVVLQGVAQYSNSHGSTCLKEHQEYPKPVEDLHWVTALRDSLIVLIKNQPKQQYHEN